MKTHLIVSLLLMIVMMASCNKKDSTDTNSAIQGTYTFKYATVKTNSTAISTDGEKSVTTSDYTTINNQGTIVFDNANITSTGFTYAVDTQAKYCLYEETDLVDSSSYPFTFTLPPSNSTGAYKLISADSIYFPQGSLTSGVGSSGSAQSAPGGGRYSWNGKLLTVTQIGSRDSTFEDSGETIHLNESAITSVVLEKH